MTPDSLENTVEEFLNPGSLFTKLQRETAELIKSPNWRKEEVDLKIKELGQRVKTDAQRGRYQRLNQEVQNRYRQRAREKIREAENLAAGVKSFDLQSVNRLLDEALRWSKDVSREADDLRRLVGERNRMLMVLEVFKQTKEKCESLWAKATGLAIEGATGSSILESVFTPAQDLATEALVKYPESLDLMALKDRAQAEFNDARRKYQILTTADATGSYKTEWEFLRKKKNQDEKLPLADAQGRPLGVFTVREAILQLEKLAEEYAHNKSHEYLAEARHLLEQLHNPEAAKAELLKYASLWMIHPEDKGLLEKEIKTKIDPEIKNLQDARAMLREAELISDPQRAWAKTEEAGRVFPYVIGLDNVRLNLADRFLNRTENAIKDGQDLLERYKKDSDNNSLLDESQRNLETALTFARQINDYGVGKEGWERVNEHSGRLLDIEKKTRQNILDERNLAVSLLAESDRIDKLIGKEPDKASKSWNELVKKYSMATLERFSVVRDLRMRIDLLKNADEILKRLVDAFNSKNEMRLNNALQECAKALDTSSENEALKKRLQERETKLRGRLHYLQGLAALNNKNGDEALIEFEQVLFLSNHPDAGEAKARAEEIKQEQKNSRKVEAEIADSKAKLKYNPRGAYEKLEKLSSSTIIRGDEIADLLEEAREKWKNKLLADLKVILSSAPLKLQKLRELAKEILEELPEPRPVDEANYALAIASEQGARLKSSQLNWTEAYKAWQEALKYDSSNEGYIKELQNARFEQLRSEFDRTRDSAQAKKIIETLATEMPNDVRRWELEAHYYFQLARDADRKPAERLVSYDEAKIALKMAREGISRLSDSAVKSHYESRLDQLAGGNSEETLLRRQTDLERRISADRSLADLVKAVNEAKDFVEKSSENRASMEGWWDALRQSVVAKLVQDDGVLGDGADDVWKRIEIRSKIINLEPNHPSARALRQSIPNEVIDVVSKIEREIHDHLAANVVDTSKDSMRIIQRQVDNAFALQSKANTLYDTLMRLEDAIGQERTKSLRDQISEKLVDLQRWMRDLEEFRRLVLQLQSHSQVARQSNNWADFENTLNLITDKGFGGHKAVTILKDQRSSVTDERGRLLSLQAQILQAAQDDSGKRFQEAIDLLEQIKNEDSQDQYGFQSTLAIVDPFTKKTIKSFVLVSKWAEKRRDQIISLCGWLVDAGLGRLVSEDVAAAYNLPISHDRQAWDVASLKKLQQIINSIADKGFFNDALNCLGLINQPESNLLKSNSRIIQHLIQDIVHLADKKYSLKELVENLSNPAVSMEQLLSSSARKMLQSLQDEAKELQPHLNAVSAMSSDILKRRSQWKDAYSEYGQATHQVKIAKQPRAYILPADGAKIKQAEERLQRAILACRAIAPNHHALDGI